MNGIRSILGFSAIALGLATAGCESKRVDKPLKDIQPLLAKYSKDANVLRIDEAKKFIFDEFDANKDKYFSEEEFRDFSKWVKDNVSPHSEKHDNVLITELNLFGAALGIGIEQEKLEKNQRINDLQ